MYSIVDLEATGGKFNEESIIEIAIYKYDGEKVIDQFISLVNPDKEISPYVEKLTGIDAKMVKTAPVKTKTENSNFYDILISRISI